jgi:8-oxo-dGTP pyrophosphatase MutT (NUDIX family)
VSETVRAAGGVVVRRSDDGPEVALVHRPKYDDWTFPKGKCELGESERDAAFREVREEIGMRCRLMREIATARYVDGVGRPKTVRYWLMEPIDGSFLATDEVDEMRWLGLSEAHALLTYDRDRRLLEQAS